MEMNKLILNISEKVNTNNKLFIGSIIRGVRVRKLCSVIISSLLMAILMSVSERSAEAQHQITIKSNCSDTIWIGAHPKVQSVKVNGTTVNTLSGWQMNMNDTAIVMVPLTWESGRFWARTGCTFETGSDPVTCGGPFPNNTPPANCCDTGGCTDSGGKWVLDCFNTGKDPTTLAEFTFKEGNQDNYDVSMVDGGNVSVEIVPDSSKYDCASDPNCILSGQSCTKDSDCFPIFGFGFAFKCDTRINGGTCVNPFRCGSPGCTDVNGCAPVGVTKSLLPPCSWDKSSEFAIPQSKCPSESQFKNQQNQGTTFVGCIAPQKFCRKACTSSAECDAPQICMNGFCSINGQILGADCDMAIMNTTKGDLWGCTGFNAGSCFTTGATDPNCCGCPSWAPGFPNGFPEGACVAGNNPEWHAVADNPSASPPLFATVFNEACPTAYSFPFDDAIKLFTCKAKSGSTTAYAVTFCQADTDGDGVSNSNDNDSDNDGIPNDTENSFSSNRTLSQFARTDAIPNSLDLDSDGDCICDILEAGGIDEDRDCVVDNFTDSDGDGHHDEHDPDQGGVALPLTDTDNDGTPDFLDSDSDNDGVTDTNETIGGMDVNGDGIHDDSEDLNGDGVADSCHPATGIPLEFLDSDGDGIFDHLDSVDNTGGGGGCSVASVGSTPSIPLYLLVPVFIVVRRAWKLYKQENKLKNE